MKKVFVCLSLIFIVTLTGCSPVEKGNYKEGTFYASCIDNFGGSNNTATAVVYVNGDGVIKSVFLDTTYTKGEIVSTKKMLGTQYSMKPASEAKGSIPGGAEWDEQVKNLEKKVVEEQGLDWLNWSDAEETQTDSVSGVTIKVNALVEALKKALEKAKITD